MKKLWKTIFTVLVLSISACLFFGTNVFAEKLNGELRGNDNFNTLYYTWEMDTETETLLIELKYQSEILPRIDGSAWQEYVDSIHHVIFKNFSPYISPDRIAKLPQVKDFSMISDEGLSWKLDMTSRTVMLNGPGEWLDAQLLPNGMLLYYDTLIIGDDIELIGRKDSPVSSLSANILILNDKVKMRTEDFERDRHFLDINQEFIVPASNPHYAVYDGVLYSKDFQTLIFCPRKKHSIQFAPGVKVIATHAFSGTEVSELIIPWGVTTLQRNSLYPGTRENKCKIVLPDTITEIGDTRYGFIFGCGTNAKTYYSRNNLSVEELRYWLKPQYNADYELVETGEELVSVEEYYPGHSLPSNPDVKPPESSTPESSVPVDSKPESKPESSTPDESQLESSKPAESSAPAESSVLTEESKPAENESVSESIPESAGVSESSEALSSEAAVSSEAELSPEEASQPDPEDQETGGGSGATIPLIIALCAALAAVGVLLFLLRKKK